LLLVPIRIVNLTLILQIGRSSLQLVQQDLKDPQDRRVPPGHRDRRVILERLDFRDQKVILVQQGHKGHRDRKVTLERLGPKGHRVMLGQQGLKDPRGRKAFKAIQWQQHQPSHPQHMPKTASRP
jgi:hypothetical protein